MTQSEQLDRQARIAECQRIVAGAKWYSETEKAVARRMLDTIYAKENGQ